MVERRNPALPTSQQCRLLALPRSSVYRKPAEVSAQDLAIMALIDRHYLARPYYGSRRMAAWLATQGHHVNRKRVQRLMRLLGLAAIYQRPNTSNIQPVSLISTNRRNGSLGEAMKPNRSWRCCRPRS
jgi:putative transposase